MKGRRVSARTTARTARPAARTARRRGGPRPGAPPRATREAIAAAAADAFSRRGFEAVAVDDIASAAGVNKAMIYYHFRDKLGLYREIVREALDATGARIEAIAGSPVPPARKLERFIAE